MNLRTLCMGSLIAAFGSSSLLAGGDVAAAEAVTRSFLTAVYQNDYDLAKAWVIDAGGLASFIGEETLDSSIRERVRADIEALAIDLAPGYEALADAEAESLPIGAPLRFSLVYHGTPMVVSTVKTADGWRVDLRWWEAMSRLARGRPVPKRHPEMLARRFLLALMQRDEKELGRLLPDGYSTDQLYPEGFEPPFEDQYFYLAMEMPLVELGEKDLVLSPDGGTAPALEPGSRDKLLVGFYWDVELHFRLIADGQSYRVAPGEHLSRIGL